MKSTTTHPAKWGLFPFVWAIFALAVGCGETQKGGSDPVMTAVLQGWQVDTVGVAHLTEGEQLNDDRGLLVIETTRVFPPEADGGEAFAWEFNALALNPVKMLVLRPVRGEERFEIIGESPMVVPRNLGANRFELPEPIPLTFPSLLAFYMPEEGTVGYREIRTWKSLISIEPLARPFIPKASFSMYGWRYGVRAFWRKQKDSAQ